MASPFSVNRALKMTLGAGVAVTGGPAGAQTDFTALCKAVAELPVNPGHEITFALWLVNSLAWDSQIFWEPRNTCGSPWTSRGSGHRDAPLGMTQQTMEDPLGCSLLGVAQFLRPNSSSLVGWLVGCCFILLKHNLEKRTNISCQWDAKAESSSELQL